VLWLAVGWVFGFITAGMLIALADRLTKPDQVAKCRCFICEPDGDRAGRTAPVRHWLRKPEIDRGGSQSR
jgi:hypothetical protein